MEELDEWHVEFQVSVPDPISQDGVCNLLDQGSLWARSATAKDWRRLEGVSSPLSETISARGATLSEQMSTQLCRSLSGCDRKANASRRIDASLT